MINLIIFVFAAVVLDLTYSMWADLLQRKPK